MPTEEEKPAKPRTRSRKSSDQRNPKAAAKAQVSDRAKAEAEPISAMSAAIEDVPAEIAQADLEGEVAVVETAPNTAESAPAAAAMEKVQDEIAHMEEAQEESAAEQVPEPALNGEVLPPEVRNRAPAAAGLAAIALAYGEYTRKSWLNGRFLVERLMTMRSFDEAVEIQGEFAKQAYTNFIVQSQKICVLYGEWAQQFFRPFEKFAPRWPQVWR